MSELHGDARYLVYGASCLPRGGNRPSYRCKRGYRCNGSANTDQRLSPRRIDGERGVYIFARAIIDGGNIPHVIAALAWLWLWSPFFMAS